MSQVVCEFSNSAIQAVWENALQAISKENDGVRGVAFEVGTSRRYPIDVAHIVSLGHMCGKAKITQTLWPDICFVMRLLERIGTHLGEEIWRTPIVTFRVDIWSEAWAIHFGGCSYNVQDVLHSMLARAEEVMEIVDETLKHD